MAQKRPFDNDENVEVSTKHPRQGEHVNQPCSYSESINPEDVSWIPPTSGEAGLTQTKTGLDENLASDVFAECQNNDENTEATGAGCTPVSSFPSASTVKESSYLESPLRNSFFSEYFNPERPSRMIHYGDIYSLLLNLPPRKSVPVGPNHQADIPVWAPGSMEDTSNHVGSTGSVMEYEHLAKDDKKEERLKGTCVIAMPELSAYDDGKVGKGRSDCCCEDQGSIRCARQHILEARVELKECLGQETFTELGFPNMGEVVADKWSNEEEQLFHKIVFSNPASSGKKFWDILSAVFPSRTKMDIVSYYYNVFMLRRRAEQNRYYPIHIDSDNDEWQGADDSGDDEDEDSVVESPPYDHRDDLGYNQSREGDMRVYAEDAMIETCNDCGNPGFFCDGGITKVSEADTEKVVKQNSNPWNEEKGDREIQDDSCTSSDTGAASQVKTDNLHDHHWPGGFNEYVLEPCHDKAWEATYTGCNLNKVDFLPTCNMIEEVFGDGSGNYKGGDSKSLN